MKEISAKGVLPANSSAKAGLPDEALAKAGYKKTKLAWIPEEWEISMVGKSFKICNSNRKPISNEIRKNMQGPYPYYGPTKIQDFINEFQYEGKYALIAEDGDHFLKYTDKRMTQLTEGKFNVNNHAHVIKGGKATTTEWFYWFFYHRNIYSHLTRQGAGRYKLNKASLMQLPVILPPLPEQRKIAAILSTWDEAIDKLDQLIRAKEEQRKGLMQRLLTSKSDWEEFKIGNIIKEVKRPIEWDDEEKYDLISVRRRSGGLFHRESLYGHQIKTKNLRNARKGDFLISKMQIVHGASGLTTEEFDGMKISGSYIAVISKDRKILDVEYLNWLSKTPWFYHLTFISSYGVHIEKMTFDYKSFIKKKIFLPSITKQQKTVNILKSSEKEIKLLVAKRNKISEQKKGLMQRLLTGKIRVV